MPRNLEKIIKSYQTEYDALEPFFDYLKARLTLDFSRLIRKSRLGGRIFFTIRIKSFTNIVEKFRLRKITLSQDRKLFQWIIDPKSPLRDVVGIRFLCLDERTIVQLIHHLLHHNSVRIEPTTYYQSIINFTPDDPLTKFVGSVGFKKDNLDLNSRTFRRYEDLNMYLFFQNIRDIPSNSELLPRRIDQPEGIHEELDELHRSYINEKRKQLEEKWVRSLPNFPIESQIVSFGMHLFNETQRPEYLAQKDLPDVPLQDMETRHVQFYLESLKHTFASARQLMEGMAQIYEGPFDYRAPLNLVENFAIENRIPSKLKPEIVTALKNLNDLVENVVKSSSALSGFSSCLENFEAIMKEPVRGLADRYLIDGTAATQYFANKKNVDFWLIHRLVLMMYAIIAGYSNKDQCIEFVRKKIDFEHNADGNTLMLHIYEKISVFDRVCEIQCKNDTEVIKFVIDPLVKWRQATAYYQLENFANAARQVRIGGKLINRRISLGLPIDGHAFPDLYAFSNREIEYEWMEIWKRGGFNPPVASQLIERLNKIDGSSSEQLLRDRIAANKCLLGFQGLISLNPEEINNNGEYSDDAFDNQLVENFIAAIQSFTDFEQNRSERSKEHKLWWNLASCISHLFSGELEKALEANEQADKRYSTVTWHPRTRLKHYKWILDRTRAICQAISVQREENNGRLTKGENFEKINPDVTQELLVALRDLARRFPEDTSFTSEAKIPGRAMKLIFGLNKSVSIVSSYHSVISALIKYLRAAE